jgi:hypothetical protein
MSSSSRWIVALFVVFALALGAYHGWRQGWWRGAPQQAAAPTAEPPRAEAPAPPPPSAVPEPQTRYPIEEVRPEGAPITDAKPLPALAESDKVAEEALARLLGRDAVRQLFQIENIVRRIVATVDNLPRKRAAARLWPIKPTPGRFAATGKDESAVLDAATNARRYAPIVKAVESVDTGRLVAFYVRLYPLFQSAYEELGYPGRHFNDRLVEVIDHLLATPAVSGPIQLVRPKVMYQFADPDMEERSAGQKTLIRMGPDNAARIKAKLREVRRQLTSAPVKG